jgi:hypothetical protein
MDMTTLAPVCEEARRIVARELDRKKATDREVAGWCRERNLEYREIPRRLEVLDSLIEEAWDLVHRLKRAGVRWAGTTREATLTIAGSAYAAWRCHDARAPGAQAEDAAAAVVEATVAGVEMAMSCRNGIATMYAQPYARLVAESGDPLDKTPPMQLLARVWPEKYAGGELRGLKTPRYAEWGEVDASSWDYELWAACPNPLTASPANLRKAVADIQATHRRAVAATRKPR